jgi:LysR family transcriptional regulator, flagellar master operon regulator
MRKTQSRIALRTSIALPDRLMDELRSGIHDIIVTYSPRVEQGLTIELIFEDYPVPVQTS